MCVSAAKEGIYVTMQRMQDNDDDDDDDATPMSIVLDLYNLSAWARLSLDVLLKCQEPTPWNAVAGYRAQQANTCWFDRKDAIIEKHKRHNAVNRTPW